jgi:SRSO17 transposase
VAIRSHHAVWLLRGQRVRQTRWRPCERVFTAGSTERRFLRETVYGTRRAIRSYQITTDPQTLPPETTWDLMTNLPGKIQQTVGNTFGLRTQDPRLASSMRRTTLAGPTTASPIMRAASAGGTW